MLTYIFMMFICQEQLLINNNFSNLCFIALQINLLDVTITGE